MTKKFILCVMAVAALSATLSACGVRPKHLKAPEGTATTYPRSYPAPEQAETPVAPAKAPAAQQ